jgi:hypothetical protein
MDGERIERVIARIEAASRRIEAAAARPALSMSSASPVGDLELERRYEALRSEAGAALAELDRLLGAIEG